MTRRGRRKPSKWAQIPVPPPGSRYRGYLRFSDRDRHNPRTTFEMQRGEIERIAAAHGWVSAGWDEEPNLSGAIEDIEKRPAFARHLRDAEAGLFEVSLVQMTDRWARDTEIAVGSLKRLRRAGVYWATADGLWDINKAITDGHSIAWVVDAEVNASYARKVSAKAIVSRRVRAYAGFNNGRVMWGYRRPTPLTPPADAPASWRSPRQPAEPHPEHFARLRQIGEWAAAGASDTAIALRARANSWILAHSYLGVREWSKGFIADLVTNPFPREFAPGSGRGISGIAWMPSGR